MTVVSVVTRIIDVALLIVCGIFLALYGLTTTLLDRLTYTDSAALKFAVFSIPGTLLAVVGLAALGLLVHLALYRAPVQATARAAAAHVAAAVTAGCLWAHAGFVARLFRENAGWRAFAFVGPALVSVRATMFVLTLVGAARDNLPTRRSVADAVTTYVVMAVAVALAFVLAWVTLGISLSMPAEASALRTTAVVNAGSWTLLVATYVMLGWSETALARVTTHRVHALAGVVAACAQAATLGASLNLALFTFRRTEAASASLTVAFCGAASAICAAVAENTVVYNALSSPPLQPESEQGSAVDEEKLQ